MAEEQIQSEQVRNKRKRLEAVEESSGPKSSFWPFVLAATLMLAFLGIVIHPILIGVGVVLTAVAVIGWGLERR